MDDEVTNPSLEKKCLLFGQTWCPIPFISIFWKVTVLTTALLMLSFAVTLWLMAMAMSRQAVEIRELRMSSSAGHDFLGLKIDSHKQLTMENRLVTTEMKGLLNGLIQQHMEPKKRNK